MKRGLLVAVAVAAVVGLLYAATLAQAGFECDACMRHDGREACRTAAATSREDAERTAISTACAVLTSGVTATIRCQATPPVSLVCRER
jgi:hypothetical protein